jgi:hypothetical protein
MEPISNEECAMKHLIAISGVAFALLTTSTSTLGQAATPPQLPALTQQQSEDLHARIDAYRRATDARVARGELSPDEAARLVAWREWQIARQVASTTMRPARAPGDAGVPPDYDASRPRDDNASRPRDDDASVPPDYDASRLRDYDVSRDYYVVEPAPYYYRYPAPYYWGPRPYAYWGPSICAGGFGRHFGGRVCF